MDDDTKDFLEQLETKHNGKMGWRTFSTWYGCSDGTFREFGVFLYKINDTFYFEDFERNQSIFGFLIHTNKKKKEFIKMEREIEAAQIDKVITTTRKNALQIIKTENTQILKSASLFEKMLFKTVSAVILKDGSIHFFELVNSKDFIAQL